MHFEVLDRRQAPGQQRFRVTTRGYAYALTDHNGAELLAWHWHPESSSPWTTPHAHVGTPALSDTGVFPRRAHIPTDRMSFEAFIRWLITEVPAAPVREDWQPILALNEERFEAHRTWE